MITALYLNVCNEVLFVYDQPVELVLQGRRSLDYGSETVNKKNTVSFR